MSDNENLTAGADPYAMLRARAEQAERARDEARALAGDHLKSRDAAMALLSAVADALPDADWQPGAMPHADAVRNIVRERDALQAKLAEAERMRNTLGRRIDEVQAALNECGAGFTGQKESTRIRALRSRLARYEAVVAEMRVRRDWLDGQCRSVGADSERRRGHVEAYETMLRWIDTALRALDAAQDSPVGVAATALTVEECDKVREYIAQRYGVAVEPLTREDVAKMIAAALRKAGKP